MSETRTAAVIFDLDGTLVDSEPNYYEAARLLLARHGAPGFTWEEHTRFIGIGTRETLQALRARYGIEASVDALLAEQDALYLELLRTSTRVFPQMRKLVELLHADGVPVAVASGSSPGAIGAALAHAGLAASFPVTVSADEVPRGKPEPDVFLEAARRLGVAPERCAVVEDAAPGVAAAHAAGMRCLAVPLANGEALDAAFATAELLFRGGQAEFTAPVAYDWLRAG